MKEKDLLESWGCRLKSPRYAKTRILYGNGSKWDPRDSKDLQVILIRASQSRRTGISVPDLGTEQCLTSQVRCAMYPVPGNCRRRSRTQKAAVSSLLDAKWVASHGINKRMSLLRLLLI